MVKAVGGNVKNVNIPKMTGTGQKMKASRAARTQWTQKSMRFSAYKHDFLLLKAAGLLGLVSSYSLFKFKLILLLSC